MQAMLDGLLPGLKGGARMLSRAITVYAPEGDVATPGSATSRPLSRRSRSAATRSSGPEGPGTTIVFRGTDQAAIDEAAAGLLSLAATLGAQTREERAAQPVQEP